MAAPSGPSRVPRDSLRGSIQQYRDSLGPNTFTERRHIAEAIGVRPAAVDTWFRGSNEPLATAYLKMAQYLRLRGFYPRIPESYDPVALELHDCVVLDVVSLDEACKAIGANRNQVLVLLRTGHRTLPDRRAALERFVKQHRHALARARMIHPLSAPQPPSAAPTTSPPPAEQPRSDRGVIVEALAAQILATLSLARMVNAPPYTNDDRAQLRELADRRGVFDLAVILYQLSGEKARTIIEKDPGTRIRRR
jgi:hypothetical protein